MTGVERFYNPDIRMLAYMVQMFWDGLPIKTIRYFRDVYGVLASGESLTVRKMSDSTLSVHDQVLRGHLNRLLRLGYLRRVSCYDWVLDEESLRPPFSRLCWCDADEDQRAQDANLDREGSS